MADTTTDAAADAFASAEYYEANFGEKPPRIIQLLARASRVVRAECPDVDDRIAAGTLDRDLVRDIVCEMVKGATASGAGVGVNSIQQTAGPYSATTNYLNAAGDMYLTKKHKRLLGCSLQKAFTVAASRRPSNPLATILGGDA